MQDIKAPKLDLIKSNLTFKMFIPTEVENKIRYACASVPNLEWSGVLFYTYSGDFNNLNLEIKCEDILLLDIGTSTYTEWQTDAEVISYMAENDLLHCQLGIIHSHNTMPTFFSGTDQNTLLQEGQDRNNIVSLIVNNEGKYSAAITRLVKTESVVKETGRYNFFGEGTKHYTDKYKTEDVFVEYFMFDIHTEESPSLFNFIGQINKVMTKKKTKVVAKNEVPTSIESTIFDRTSYPVASTPAVDFNKTNTVIVKANELHDKIKEIAYQLVTGNIFGKPKNKYDLQDYIVQKMYLDYKNRFGTDVSNSSPFVSWIDSIIDFFVFENTPILESSVMDPYEDEISVVIQNLIDYLETFKATNQYIKIIITRLRSFL